MATGRTVLRWSRIYIDGRDLSGYSRSFGPLACTFEEGADDAISKTVKGTYISNASISMGTLNGIFDNTATSGVHAVLSSAGTKRTVMIAQGIQAAPAAGDPVFAGQFTQLGYQAGPDAPLVTATIPFGNTNAAASNMLFSQPWGILLHPLGAETGASTANGFGGGGQTTYGGWMCYQISTAAGTGNITATLKVQDSTAADGAFSDLITSGELSLGSGGTFGGPVAGIVALAPTATVESFTRFQIAFNAATSVTFALSFHRGYF